MAETSLAFVDVSVVPMDSERVLEHQTVLVEGDRITRVAAQHEVSLPAVTQRIDGRGKYLMPALADMHCHPLSEYELSLFVTHGVTTIRNMLGLPRHLDWRRRITAGELLGPRIYTTGQFVDGPAPRMAWKTTVRTRQEAVAAVVETKRDGYDAVKIDDQLEAGTYHDLMEAAAQNAIPVDGHVPFRVGLSGALRAGQRSLEHLWGYLEALLPPGRRPSSPVEARAMILAADGSFVDERLQELAEMTREHGAWNCPTLVVRQIPALDRDKILERPEVRYLSPLQLHQRRCYANVTAPTDEARRMWELHLRMTKALSDAGAGLLPGADAGIPTVVAGVSLHQELQAFAEAGLTPYQAIRTATSDAARFLGASEDWGVVASGLRADILLLDADPLTDVANTEKIAGVLAAGRWLPARELRHLRDDLSAERRRSDAKPSLVRRRHRPATRTRRYQAEWEGFAGATEEVTLVPRAGGGRLLRSRARVALLINERALPGIEAGSYRTEVVTDADGNDRHARFEYEGPDGRDRIDVVRAENRLHIRSTTSWSGERDDVLQTEADSMLSRPLIVLWVQLGQRIRDLEVGQERTVQIAGPGLPPDYTVFGGEIRVRRTTDRYAFELQRPNITIAGTLEYDRDGWPVEIEMSVVALTPSNTTTRVRRVDRGLGV
jgi:hypothetical protein